MQKRIRTAVIPAAGLGTRNFVSPVIPKELLVAYDRPLIQHVVDEAREAGIQKFVFVISEGKESVVEHFRTHDNIEQLLRQRKKHEVLSFIEQTKLRDDQIFVAYQDTPRGLGHAVWCAKEHVGNEPFAVLLPDEVMLGTPRCLEQMISVYNRTGGNVIASMQVPQQDTKKYGILDIKNGRIVGMVEKPSPEAAPSTAAIIGRYVLQPEILDVLEKQTAGAGGEIQLTDAMCRSLGTQLYTNFAYHGERHDCGYLDGLLGCTQAIIRIKQEAEATPGPLQGRQKKVWGLENKI